MLYIVFSCATDCLCGVFIPAVLPHDGRDSDDQCHHSELVYTLSGLLYSALWTIPIQIQGKYSQTSMA